VSISDPLPLYNYPNIFFLTGGFGFLAGILILFPVQKDERLKRKANPQVYFQTTAE